MSNFPDFLKFELKKGAQNLASKIRKIGLRKKVTTKNSAGNFGRIFFLEKSGFGSLPVT